MGRSGRRPGRQDTRRTILASARDQFAARGYDGASVRQIATDAGVDPALVHHYFGTKEKLFHAVLEIPVGPDELIPEIFAGRTEDVPERLVRTFLGVWENPVTGPAMVGFLRTMASQRGGSRLVREFFSARIVRTVMIELGDRVAVEEAPYRVSLVASQLLGLALTRHVFEFDALATVDAETVVVAVAPTVERYLFGPLAPGDPADLGATFSRAGRARAALPGSMVTDMGG